MNNERPDGHRSFLDPTLYFCLNNKLVVGLMLLFAVGWGLRVAPFDWDLGDFPRDPVPVDAIPDTGENQQIVFTQWKGHSPQDMEDQVTSWLTVQLQGIPGIKTIRSSSLFGFSSIQVIFKDGVDFDWSRDRINERINNLPAGTLPEGVQPALGPSATALGQVFWYTLEGRDSQGNPAGGWDLEELRSIQDFKVRYALQAANGVAEVASIGGFVQEYQIDVDPDAMRAYKVTLDEVFRAVKESNVEVGARTIEINQVEYIVRGIGFIKSVKDLEDSVIKENDNVKILIKHVAHVTLGPAPRRGALDKGGVEAVGGVVVVAYGENPLAVIQNVKEKIGEIESGLDKKALIDYASVTPEQVQQFAQANGLGAARAITEKNQPRWLSWAAAHPDQIPPWLTISQVTVVPFYDRTGLIYETLDTLNTALTEEILVTIAVVLLMVLHLRSSILIAGLLPVAALICFIGMKTFGVDANIVALSGIAIAIGTMVDMGIVLCENILRHLKAAEPNEKSLQVVFRASSEVGSAVLTAVATTVIGFLPVFTLQGEAGKLFRPLAYTKTFALVAAVIVALVMIPPAAHLLFVRRKRSGPAKSGPRRRPGIRAVLVNLLVVWIVVAVLTDHWSPLGSEKGLVLNFLFAAGLIGGLLLLFYFFRRAYVPILSWCLAHKLLFLSLPTLLIASGVWIWQSLGEEFMPHLDEGSFLYMPTTMTHASIGEALDVLHKVDRAIESVPEVESVVGKIGRVESALDPAPISMLETVINYKPEYRIDADGERYRQWRSHIRTPDDIWAEIVRVAQLTGTTSASKLQPIETRLLMLQSNLRAAMGVKVKGYDLETVERVGLQIEKLLKQVNEVRPASVNADRIVGKPYLKIEIDRERIDDYGLTIRKVQDVIEVAIGGRPITTAFEGRERYAVRVRYPRELRNTIESMERILVPAPSGAQIPLSQLTTIRYERGPQAIKSEDTQLVGYVTFDMKPGHAEVDVVEACQKHLKAMEKSGKLDVTGASYDFTGRYESQLKSKATLMVALPAALFLIFIILYLQFRSTGTTLIVFCGIAVAAAGGFLLLGLYGQPWFLNFSVFGVSLRELFQVHPIHLSTAVWVGFLALFGIASDDGVLMATYLNQVFRQRQPATVAEIRSAAVEAAKRRIRPCLMTSATTILALIPVLTSDGRGADVMVPMAIPVFGGMTVVLVSVFIVPVLYSLMHEVRLKFSLSSGSGN